MPHDFDGDQQHRLLRIMRCLHKLGNAKTEANYQTLIKDGTVNGATSNAYLTSSNVRFKTKCIIMK